MRKLIVLALILVLCTFFVSAKQLPISERFSFEEGQTIEFNGKLITLLNLDFDKERTVVCVNGEKTILARNTKELNGVSLDLRKVTLSRADIRVLVNCPGCECDENCDNSLCFDDCFTHADCDDGNDLTDDECYGTPNKCHYSRTKECLVDEHCVDDDECTIDKCSDVLDKCVHTEKADCDVGGEVASDKITSAVVLKTDDKEKYNPQKVHKILFLATFGIMLVVFIVKKFK